MHADVLQFVPIIDGAATQKKMRPSVPCWSSQPVPAARWQCHRLGLAPATRDSHAAVSASTVATSVYAAPMSPRQSHAATRNLPTRTDRGRPPEPALHQRTAAQLHGPARGRTLCESQLIPIPGSCLGLPYRFGFTRECRSFLNVNPDIPHAPLG